MCVTSVCRALLYISATALLVSLVVGDDTEDRLRCLEHFLDKFIRTEAPMKIEALLAEYSEQAGKFSSEIKKHFRAAHDAVEHSFEHIKDRIPDGMNMVKKLANSERFSHLLPGKFVAEVMQMFSDDELQEACLDLCKKKEILANEAASKLLSLIADRVETIGRDGAQAINKKCHLN